MRVHMEVSALEIVARLIESETANSNPYHEHDSITSTWLLDSRVATAYIQLRQLLMPGRRYGFRFQF